ncbi:MAG: hypothetical protein M1503_03030 [Thaumarchaeota archaeon]|nr:hypothetical protein [Nitrososphaerota archaeon]
MRDRPPKPRREKYSVDDETNEDALIIAAFVLGVHMRGDVDSHQIVRHSPLEIARTANREILRTSKQIVTPSDVAQVLSRLLKIIDG